MEKFKKLLETVTSLQSDAEKSAAGNKSAGVRLRKGMQEVKRIAQEVREGVLGE